MKCWFKRDPKSEWTPGPIVGYVGAANAGAAVVKVDKRGELLSLPLAQVSIGDTKPEDGHEHYKDPRYIESPALTEPKTQATTAKPFREASGK